MINELYQFLRRYLPETTMEDIPDLFYDFLIDNWDEIKELKERIA